MYSKQDLFIKYIYLTFIHIGVILHYWQTFRRNASNDMRIGEDTNLLSDFVNAWNEKHQIDIKDRKRRQSLHFYAPTVAAQQVVFIGVKQFSA